MGHNTTVILTAAGVFGTVVFIIVFWIIIRKNRKKKTFIDEIATLMWIEGDLKFHRSRIAERISLLTKFSNEDFAKPERYTGENKKLFNAFNSLSPKNRRLIIDDLGRML